MSKIFYDIGQSEYSAMTHKFIFYFSSKFYRDKFISEYVKNREEMSYKLSSRYNIVVNANDYFDFILYSLIEKRGFRVIGEDGVLYTCLNQVQLNGWIKTLES